MSCRLGKHHAFRGLQALTPGVWKPSVYNGSWVPQINLNLSIRITDSADSGDCTSQERLGCAAVTAQFHNLRDFTQQMFISRSHAISDTRHSANERQSGTKANVSISNLGSQDCSGGKRGLQSQAPAIKCFGPEGMGVTFTRISLSNDRYVITPNSKRTGSTLPLVIWSWVVQDIGNYE